MPPDNDSTLSPQDNAAFEQMREADSSPASAPAPEPVETDTSADIAIAAPTDVGDEPEAPADVGQQRTVPHAALHEERERRKTVEKRAESDRKEWESRFNALLERFPQQQAAPQPQQQAPQAPPLPDPEKDPVGHFMERLNRQDQLQRAIVQAIVSDRQQAAQATQVSQATQALQNRAIAAEAQFTAEVPDYQKAANFLAETRHKDLVELGYEDAGDRQEIIKREALDLAQRAMQMGRNPATIIYNMAKSRGYTAPKDDPAPGTGAAEQVAQIAAGQQQARTLSNVRGAAPAGMNANAVMNMTPKDFASFLSKATPEQMENVFGH